MGRDIFSRVIVATRLDTFIAVASVVLVFLMGGLAGIAAGYFGGWTDRIVGRIADTIMAFPLFVLAMGIVAALGNTVQNIIIATAIVNFPLYARVARAEANVRRDAGFVQAARLSGNGEFRILLVHILPNIMPIMIVQMSLTMGYAILNAAGLSFIGLGVRPPTAEWGIMVAEGAGFMVSGEWWIALFPGLALMIAVFCFNLLGDGLRDIVDPQRTWDDDESQSPHAEHCRSRLPAFAEMSGAQAMTAHRCSMSAISPSNSPPGAASSRRCSTSISPSPRARRSASSANPAPANRSPPMR